MNRRNVLIALAAVAIMTGVVFGTGAFTQVEADRSLDVNVAEDSAAFLALEPVPENDEYVGSDTGDAGNNVVTLDLTSTTAGGQGINDDAVTTIDPVLNVTNQGTQEINVTLSAAPQGVDFTSAPDNLGVGATGQIGIEVAAGDAPRTVNGGTLGGDLTGETITISAEATGN
jgi:hypothetical protein